MRVENKQTGCLGNWKKKKSQKETELGFFETLKNHKFKSKIPLSDNYLVFTINVTDLIIIEMKSNFAILQQIKDDGLPHNIWALITLDILTQKIRKKDND